MSRPRLLVVGGGDYAALNFKNEHDPDTMTAQEIRALVAAPDSWGDWRDMRIIEVDGPCNRALFSAVLGAAQDYDAAKHEDVWYFEEEEEDRDDDKKKRKLVEKQGPLAFSNKRVLEVD